jgi:hypothetical protein
MAAASEIKHTMVTEVKVRIPTAPLLFISFRHYLPTTLQKVKPFRNDEAARR